jgi:hypothetical protein
VVFKQPEAASEIRPVSSLTGMMIECARMALREKDYGNALEYLLTVASVDDHPEVTRALGATALCIVDDLCLAPGASVTKARFLESVSRTDVHPNYEFIRQCFDRDTVFRILELVRLETGWFPRRRRFDHVAADLIENINRVLDGKRPEAVRAPLKSMWGNVDIVNFYSGAFRLQRSQLFSDTILNALDSVGDLIIGTKRFARLAFREVRLAVLAVLVLTVTFAAFYFIRENLGTNLTIVQHLSADNRCSTYAGRLHSLLQFFLSMRGGLTILSFIVLKRVATAQAAIQMKERRELNAVATTFLALFFSVLVFGSTNITQFITDPAKICHNDRGAFRQPLGSGGGTE